MKQGAATLSEGIFDGKHLAKQAYSSELNSAVQASVGEVEPRTGSAGGAGGSGGGTKGGPSLEFCLSGDQCALDLDLVHHRLLAVQGARHSQGSLGTHSAEGDEGGDGAEVWTSQLNPTAYASESESEVPVVVSRVLGEFASRHGTRAHDQLTRKRAHDELTHERMRPCTHAPMHPRTHAHMHTCTHAHMHARTHARTHMRASAQRMLALTRPCARTHTHTHTHLAFGCRSPQRQRRQKQGSMGAGWRGERWTLDCQSMCGGRWAGHGIGGGYVPCQRYQLQGDRGWNV